MPSTGKPVTIAAIPDGYRCLKCEYVLSGLRTPICPECGEPASASDIEVFLSAGAHRKEFLGGRSRRLAARWIVVLVAAGLVGYLWVPAHGPFLSFLIWLAMGVIASLPPRPPAADRGHPELRRVHRALWLSLAPVVHLFWMLPLAVMALLWLRSGPFVDLSLFAYLLLWLWPASPLLFAVLWAAKAEDLQIRAARSLWWMHLSLLSVYSGVSAGIVLTLLP